MNLRNRGISKFEIEALFRDVLNQKQIEQIGNLLKLLGMYVLLERKQLAILAERHFNEKIGLSFIQKAVRYNLVAELQNQEDPDTFYFQLKQGGFLVLEGMGIAFRKLPLLAAATERAKILAINNYLIEKGHLLSNTYVEGGLYEPLITKDDVVLLIEIDPSEIIEILEKQIGRPLAFEQMDLKQVEMDSQIKGNIQSMLL